MHAQEVQEITQERLKKLTYILCSNAYTLAGSEQRSKGGKEIEGMFLKEILVLKETIIDDFSAKIATKLKE